MHMDVLAARFAAKRYARLHAKHPREIPTTQPCETMRYLANLFIGVACVLH
jgi:hypothetical protein